MKDEIERAIKVLAKKVVGADAPQYYNHEAASAIWLLTQSLAMLKSNNLV